MTGPTMRWRATLGYIVAGVVLALTFAAYLRPDMAFAFATQLWNCF